MTVKKIESLEGKIEKVDLSVLKVHTMEEDPEFGYQRGLKPHRKAIAQNFNAAAAGVLHVARRSNGDLYILDGQQRWAGMKQLGISQWRALVINSSGPQYEAVVYKMLNGKEGRKGLNSSELFYASLVAKDPIAEACVRAVEAAGLKLKKGLRGGSRHYTELPCLTLMYRMVKTHGEQIVERGLKLLVKTWPMQQECMCELIPYSCITIVANFGDMLDEELFVKQLGLIPPRKILLDAAVQTNNRYGAAVDSICKSYNSGTRSKVKKLKIHTEVA